MSRVGSPSYTDPRKGPAHLRKYLHEVSEDPPDGVRALVAFLHVQGPAQGSKGFGKAKGVIKVLSRSFDLKALMRPSINTGLMRPLRAL